MSDFVQAACLLLLVFGVPIGFGFAALAICEALFGRDEEPW